MPLFAWPRLLMAVMQLIFKGGLLCGVWGCQTEEVSQPGCTISTHTCSQANLCQEKVCEGVGWTCAWDVGTKTYQWLLEATCDDHDLCTKNDVCLAGQCKGERITCPPSGDPCSLNVCKDGQCRPESLDCNTMPHATGSCEQGQCKLICVSGYGDCDGDWRNGCEIPVGVSNSCNRGGIVTEATGGEIPCGTAYCGKASEAKNDVINFGTYYCKLCSHCHFFPERETAMYAWCDGSTGNFDDNRSYCEPSFWDRVCVPPLN